MIKIIKEVFPLLAIILFFPPNIQSQMKSPEEFKKHLGHLSIDVEQGNTISLARFSIIFYQKVISPINGESCPMYPSCSQYSKEAFKDNLLMGLLKTTDRLFRCGHNLKYYKKVKTKSGQCRWFDPVKQQIKMKKRGL